MPAVEVDLGEIHDGAEPQRPEPVGVVEVEAAAVPRDTVEFEMSFGLPERRHPDRLWLQPIEVGVRVVAGIEVPAAVEACAPGGVEPHRGGRLRCHACGGATGPEPATVRDTAWVSSRRSSPVNS